MKPTLTLNYKSLLIFLAIFFAFTPYDSPGGSYTFGLIRYILVLSMMILYFGWSIKNIEVSGRQVAGIVVILSLLGMCTFNSLQDGVANLFRVIISITSAYLIYIAAMNNINIVRRAIYQVMAVHVFFLYAQVAIYSIFGSLVDFHNILYPFSYARLAIYDEIGVVRFSGLQNEPGTYAAMVSLLIFLKFIYSMKTSIFDFLLVFSVILTFSSAGFVFCSLLFISILWSKRHSRLALIVVAFSISACVGISLYFGVLDYLLFRFNTDGYTSPSLLSKLQAIEFFIQADPMRQLLGSGLGFNDCYDCDSIQDLGVLYNFVNQLGIFSIIIFTIHFLLFPIKGVVAYIFLFSMFLSKLYIVEPAIWIALMLTSFCTIKFVSENE
tara:strand:+ start:4457 stop:5602 length:1146 start_codon:yes stop_codon:yes gene_type:complete